MTNDGMGSQISLLIREIKSLTSQHLRNRMKDCGLTVPQMMIVGILSKGGKMKVSDISSEMSLANSTVSGILDRLEKLNIIKRVRSEEDKRVVYIELFDKTKDIHEEFMKDLNEFMDSLVISANKEDIRDILRGLQKLRELLLKHELPAKHAEAD